MCGRNLGEEDLGNAWTALNVVYNGEFKNLVHSGTLPNEADVLATLKSLKERLSSIKWDIKNNK